jgi:hypothetical protein
MRSFSAAGFIRLEWNGADGQRQRALGTRCLEQLAGLVHTRLGASDHGLDRVVEIHGLDHFGRSRTKGCSRLGATSNHPGRLHAQNGCHGPRTHRHGLVHGCGAQAHQRRCLCQCQHAGGHQR